MVVGMTVLMLIWVALTRTIESVSLMTGFLCCALLVAFWHHVVPDSRSSAHCILRHPLRSMLFAATLAYRFLLSTLHTSWMIVRGGEEGRIVALPLRLKDPFAQFVLLNSITLTPSTISLLTEEDLLYIHWLQPAAGESDWRGIKESLERRLADVFERSGGWSDAAR